AFARICGASLVLLPWGAWLVMRSRQGDPAAQSSLFGLSPVRLRLTVLVGIFGGLAYPLLAYTGFFFAPATHASVLMPGSLPLWAALLAAIVLRDRVTPGRAIGLALIVLGDLFVGGASLFDALARGGIWKGDLPLIA